MSDKFGEVAKQVEEVAEQVADRSLAFELVQELSRANDKLEKSNERLAESNRRKDRTIVGFVIGFLFVVLAMTVSFLVYLYQYDYSVEATGVFAMVDSNGNVLAYDFSQEELEMALNYVMEARISDGES